MIELPSVFQVFVQPVGSFLHLKGLVGLGWLF
jgi:hypothetical protein